MTDDNSGMTREEAAGLGIFIMPMPFFINGELTYQSETFTRKDFYNKLAEGADVSTSQPSPGDVMDMWNDILSKGYDEIVYIPMSSGLSASCSTAMGLARDYDGKVQVVDNQRISVTMQQSVMDAKHLVAAGKSAAQIKEILEKEALESSIYLMVDTLKYLKKGGRISKTTAFAGGILNIKPVLTIQDGEVVVIGKARGSKQGNNLLVEKIHNSGGIDFSMPILLGYSGLSDVFLKKYVEDSRALWQEGTDTLDSTLLCSVIGTHTGPGVVAVAFFKKSSAR